MREKLESLSFKTKLYTHYALCVIGSLTMMAGCAFSPPGHLHTIVIIGIIILTTGLIFRILFIKCPHCGDGLYQSHSDLKNCPNCKKPLR